MISSKRHPFIMGTLILTITGLVSRIIGFFYRIYLARLFGEEGMGIYQLISPVLALSFSLTAAGYQTAISKFVAQQSANIQKNSHQQTSYLPLFIGLSISLPLSFLCSGIVFTFSDFIACHLLLEARTASMLRILAFSIPLSSVHSCVNGHFYGIKKTGVPALSQLIEQLSRVGCVYVVSAYAISKGEAPTINVAILGLAFGELISMLISIAAVYFRYAKEYNSKFALHPSSGRLLPVYGSILGMALPLTANRVVLNLLHSVESVSIPNCLRSYGYNTSTALSVYGVLTGMAMPLIFFPNALTGSVAVLLLPMISESYALGDMDAVRRTTIRTIKYCCLLGIACTIAFFFLGSFAGPFLFDSALAGHFITTLSFLCPFLYLDTTLSSILQGLGMAGRIFFMNVICLLVRLGFIFLTIPRFGITGYLWGILASQILLTVLYLICLFHFSTRKAIKKELL